MVASTYQYDAVGRLLSLTHTLGDGEATAGDPNDIVAGYGFTYDAASRIAGFTVTDRPDESATFNYDDTNQLAGADRDGTSADEAYDYDANGNRDSAGYTTDPHNRTTSDGTFAFTYVAEGNRTSKTRIAGAAADDHSVEYHWDHRNRLTAVVFKNNAGDTTKTVAYQYDAFDHVIGKLLDTIVVQTAERYAYDGNQIVLSFNGNAAGELTLDRRYLWGPTVDQLLAQENMRQAISSAVRTYWTLTDHQNTVRDLLDAAGFVEAHFGYDGFGRLTLAVDGADDPITNAAALTYFLYTARLYDADSDLQNNHHRWYDNTLGKWISEDPIGFAAGDANTSRYIGNATFAGSDPFGLFLVAVDGSESGPFSRTPEYRYGVNRTIGFVRSHVANFYRDYKAKASDKMFRDGPTTAGFGGTHLVDTIYNRLKEEYCKDKDVVIDMVGHSRGGLVVLEVARRLNSGFFFRTNKLWPSFENSGPIRVRFLGLYDPVDMHWTQGNIETIPGNVQQASAVYAVPAINGGISRGYFNRIHGEPANRDTFLDRLYLAATHAAIGGAPWAGDHPPGHSEANDIQAAIAADLHIRRNAVFSGVPVTLRAHAEYVYTPTAGVFQRPQGVVPVQGNRTSR